MRDVRDVRCEGCEGCERRRDVTCSLNRMQPKMSTSKCLCVCWGQISELIGWYKSHPCCLTYGLTETVVSVLDIDK